MADGRTDEDSPLLSPKGDDQMDQLMNVILIQVEFQRCRLILIQRQLHEYYKKKFIDSVFVNLFLNLFCFTFVQIYIFGSAVFVVVGSSAFASLVWLLVIVFASFTSVDFTSFNVTKMPKKAIYAVACHLIMILLVPIGLGNYFGHGQNGRECVTMQLVSFMSLVMLLPVWRLIGTVQKIQSGRAENYAISNLYWIVWYKAFESIIVFVYTGRVVYCNFTVTFD